MKINSLRGEWLQLADDAIIAAVHPDTLARLRSGAGKPILRAYRVAHEGVASGNIVGRGLKVARIVKDAVIQLFDALPHGLKTFLGHANTNEHDGRTVIGEVVGKALRMIDGALSAVAIVHLFQPFEKQAGALDVASLESEIEFEERGGDEIGVVNYRAITGLALGSAATQSPGFPGATLLGAVQAFANHGVSRDKGDGTMTLEELKAAIQEGKHKPSDLFGEEALKSDPAVTRHVRAEKQTEYEHAKRVEGRLSEARQEVESLKTAQATELSKAREGAIRGVLTARDSVAKFCEERKLNTKQTAWVQKNLARFTPQATEDVALKTELNKWLDDQLADYVSAAAILAPGEAKKPEDNASDGGAPADDATPGGDLTDPKNNDLIPKG